MFLAACGGGGAGTGALSADQAQGICEQSCEYEASCGTEDDVAGCTTDCVDQVVGWFRADAAQSLVDCQSELACTAEDDQCLLDVEPLAIHEEWEQKCRAQLAECAPDPTQLDEACEVSPDPANDDIGFFRFIAPEIMAELIDCLDGADCNARLTCVQASLDAHGINF